MLSPCMREALNSESGCHGCCPNPFLGLLDQSSNCTNTKTTSQEELKLNINLISSLFLDTKFTNHESLPPLQESFSIFTELFPLYLQTDQADQIRAQDYFHLSMYNRVCFDYIGHGLFSYSQLHSHFPRPSVASSSSFPPPISLQLEPPFFDISYRCVNLSSWIEYGGKESDIESIIRKRIMDFMNISQDDYSLVFTANQSSAFKLLAESYSYYSGTRLLTVYDCENEAEQVMKESSKKKGARILSAEFSWPNLRIQLGKLMKKIMGKKKKKRGLFVFPLQSRVTGARYSYQWMSIAQENGWDVLLDATALGPKYMDTLGLSLFKPDFLICSFYKIFGENPSGFGCLFIKKSSASVLQDSTVVTSMGIVSLVPSMKPPQFSEELIRDNIDTRQKSKSLEKDEISITGSFSETISIQRMRDEDEEKIIEKSKELSFSKIVELETPNESGQSTVTQSSINENSKLKCEGLDHADSLGLILISKRARYLINWLVNALMSLQHPHPEQGHSLVRIYGPKAMFDRALSVAFNVFDWNGTKIDPALVQKLADRYNISLSCGFLQHIWFSNKYEEEKEMLLETRTATEVTILKKRGDVDATQTHSGISVVTASLGFLTNFEDTYRLWAFVSRFLDADFVEKERRRYMALNQKIIEI